MGNGGDELALAPDAGYDHEALRARMRRWPMTDARYKPFVDAAEAAMALKTWPK